MEMLDSARPPDPLALLWQVAEQKAFRKAFNEDHEPATTYQRFTDSRAYEFKELCKKRSAIRGLLIDCASRPKYHPLLQRILDVALREQIISPATFDILKITVKTPSILKERAERLLRPSRERRSFTRLPPRVANLYDEVINAYNIPLPLVYTAGLRMLLEEVYYVSKIGTYATTPETAIPFTPHPHVPGINDSAGFNWLLRDIYQDCSHTIHNPTAPSDETRDRYLTVVEVLLELLYA